MLKRCGCQDANALIALDFSLCHSVFYCILCALPSLAHRISFCSHLEFVSLLGKCKLNKIYTGFQALDMAVCFRYCFIALSAFYLFFIYLLCCCMQMPNTYNTIYFVVVNSRCFCCYCYYSG